MKLATLVTTLSIAAVTVSPVFAQDAAQNVTKAKGTLNKMDALIDGIDARHKSASAKTTRTVVTASATTKKAAAPTATKTAAKKSTATNTKKATPAKKKP